LYERFIRIPMLTEQQFQLSMSTEMN
jgi:hypothetical protein